MKRALARLIKIVAGTAIVAGAALGFAHTPAGRPLLASVTRMAHGRCPLGYDEPMDPAKRERAQRNFAQTHRGGSRAQSRLALGFELGRTTRAGVVAALAERGIQCLAGRG